MIKPLIFIICFIGMLIGCRPVVKTVTQWKYYFESSSIVFCSSKNTGIVVMTDGLREAKIDSISSIFWIEGFYVVNRNNEFYSRFKDDYNVIIIQK